MQAVEIKNITKIYKETIALEDACLSINSGELFGLIGADGAGKSTLIRIIASLLIPNAGTVRVGKLDPIRDYKVLRKKIGYMPGRFSLYPDLTVEENLNFFASVFKTSIKENYHLIKSIYSHIEPFKNRRAGQLSGGMKQKLALSCALIHKPELLLLDEPTTGVDAVSRKEFWDMLKGLQNNNLTIIVSTPYMDEASLCDRIALIHGGKILATASPAFLTQNFNKTVYKIEVFRRYDAAKSLKERFPNASVNIFGQSIHLTSNEPTINSAIIADFLADRKYSEILVNKIDATIEDCFIEYCSIAK